MSKVVIQSTGDGDVMLMGSVTPRVLKSGTEVELVLAPGEVVEVQAMASAPDIDGPGSGFAQERLGRDTLTMRRNELSKKEASNGKSDD